MSDDLRAFAMAATPGPWEVDGILIMVRGGDAVAMVNLAAAERGRKDAAYIAALSPERVLAMLDERDQMQRVIDAADGMRAGYCSITYIHGQIIPDRVTAFDVARAKLKGMNHEVTVAPKGAESKLRSKEPPCPTT